jgi:hypothetical protein
MMRKMSFMRCPCKRALFRRDEVKEESMHIKRKLKNIIKRPGFAKL